MFRSDTDFVRGVNDILVCSLKYDIEICCEECENVIGAVPTMFLERSTKDYGKTWALSREELENENQNKTNQ